jgi:hypothetical protein
LLKLTSFIVLTVLIMDQPNTSMVIGKPSKVEDKEGRWTNDQQTIGCEILR